MKKSFMLLFIMTIICHNLIAQEREAIQSPSKSIIRAHIFLPGIMLERALSYNSTMIFDLSFGVYTEKEDWGNKIKKYRSIYPVFRLEPRIYTAIEKRKYLNKRTEYYCGPYMGLQFKLSPVSKAPFFWSLAPMFGYQNTFGERGYWSLGLGVGPVYTVDELKVGLIADIGLGVIIK